MDTPKARLCSFQQAEFLNDSRINTLTHTHAGRKEKHFSAPLISSIFYRIYIRKLSHSTLSRGFIRRDVRGKLSKIFQSFSMPPPNKSRVTFIIIIYVCTFSPLLRPKIGGIKQKRRLGSGMENRSRYCCANKGASSTVTLPSEIKKVESID